VISPNSLGEEINARTQALAAITESPGGLTRRYLTPEHRKANDLVAEWMADAGMRVREDAAGNVVGRYEGESPGQPALMLGSHLDTVIDAGRYDGMLGVVTAVSCVKALNRRNRPLPFAIEVIGFADEEGVRFQSSYLGSRAVAGTFETALLEREDADGLRMADAMTAFGLDPARVGEAARRPEEALAYLELHIEQGPVLEREGLPVGVVTGIAGAAKLAVTITGEAGHAGTVPMSLRQDALPAAAESVLALERICRGGEGLVGTVGSLAVLPGAVNVIPGRVRFTVDLRAAENSARIAALSDFEVELRDLAGRRHVEVSIDRVHDADSVACSAWLMDRLGDAVTAEGWRAIRLPSGAGHDAAAMADLTDVGMLFVRCRGGISHNPTESITIEDAEAGARVLLRVMENFKPRPAPPSP
jgi:allantoate deiminase